MSTDPPRQPEGAIHVAIVEDDDATREGLRRLVHETPGYSCVGAFRSVEDLLGASMSPSPDVFLVDIGLPGVPGTEGVRTVKERYPNAQAVMLTVYAEDDTIFEAICNGACGYLLKDTAPAKLLEAISDAHRGGAPMSREIARKVVSWCRRGSPPPKLEARLSPQELRLVELLAQGYSYQGASNQMNVSVNTVRNYVRAVYEKLHVHTKSEAVSKVMRSRLIGG